MKNFLFFMVAILFSPSVMAKDIHNPFAIDKPWGGPAPYAERLHPGIDYGVASGAPVIVAAKGKVVLIKDFGQDGWEVSVAHGNHFRSVYIHLSRVLVEVGQIVKRGQMIALSGESNSWNKPHYAHLHFGICKIGPGHDCQKFSESLDPNLFWLDGKPLCFEPQRDYSSFTQKDLTLPLACGDHAKELVRTVAGSAK